MFVNIVVAIVCLASSTVLAAYEKPYYDVEDAENLFMEFVKEHNKVYDQREYYERLEIFKATLKDINERNAKFPNTVFAVNHFADLKPHELPHYRGFKMPDEYITELEIPDEWSVPGSFDWRTKNVVSPVQNTGSCTSASIISAIGEIEGQYAIKHQTKECVPLSVQQVLDCIDSADCEGGYNIRKLAKKQMKLERETDYPPYNASKEECRYEPSKGLVQVATMTVFGMSDEEKLKAKLVNHGPISMAISGDDLVEYKGGILVPNYCNGAINHVVLLVGYGEESGQQYWIIKNSWGTGWGEQGYARILLGVNACGIGHYLAISTIV